jgi:hypothetical protein
LLQALRKSDLEQFQTRLLLKQQLLVAHRVLLEMVGQPLVVHLKF